MQNPLALGLRLCRAHGLEILASVTTLAGMHYGSTTSLGASLYLVSWCFWMALMWSRRMWGLLPLNIATVVISGSNLYQAGFP